MLLPLEQEVCTVQMHNDLIVLVSCQIDTQVLPRLKGVDVVEEKEGIMPASKGMLQASQHDTAVC